jgi:hypothetical protein
MSLPVKQDCRMYDFADGSATVRRIRALRLLSVAAVRR